MFALSDAREFSFSQVPYLERDQKITDQSNFVNDVTSLYSTFSGGNLRELIKQHQWRQLQNRHLKSVFSLLQLCRPYFISFRLYRSSPKRKRKSMHTFRPSQKGTFMSKTCSDGKEMLKKSVIHVQSCC